MRELGVQIRDLKIVVTTQLLIFAVENVTVRLPGPPLSSHQTVTATISLQRPPVAVTRPDQQQLQSPQGAKTLRFPALLHCPTTAATLHSVIGEKLQLTAGNVGLKCATAP